MAKKQSLHGFLISRTLPISALLLLIISLVTYQSTQKLAIENQEQTHDIFLKNFAAQTLTTLTGLLQQTQNIASNGIVINGLIDTAGRDNYVPLFFDTVAIAGVQDPVISYFDYAGRVIASNIDNAEDLIDTSIWLERSLVKGEPFIGFTSAFLTIVAPVKLSGFTEGAIAIQVDSSEYSNLFRANNPFIEGWIIDSSGEVILSKGSLDNRPATFEEADLAKLGMSRQETMTLPAGGSVKFVSFEAYETANNLAQRLSLGLMLTVLAGLLGVILAVYLSSSATARVLGKLSTTIESIRQKGRLLLVDKLSGPIELEKLGSQFNDMIEELRLSTVSKERVSSIFNSMQELLLVTDLNGDFIESNQRCVEYAEERKLKVDRDVFVILGFDRSHEMFDLKLAQNQHLSYYFDDLDASQDHAVAIRWRRSELLSQDQRVIGFVFVGTDVTYMKLAEEQLSITNKAIDAATNGITIADAKKPDLPLIYVNQTFEDMTGHLAEEIIGTNCRFLQGPETSKESIDNIRLAIKEKRPHREELINYRRNGEPFWCELALTPVFDEHGELCHYLGVQSDISDRVENELQLKASIEEAQRANKAKDDFLSTMSHEIRTPMNGVVGMAEVLLRTELNKEQKETVQTMVNSGRALVDIINDILDFSKIEAGKLELERVNFSLAKLSLDALNLFKSLAQDKMISLIYDYDPSFNTRFEGDPGRIRQILVNLIGNALKFTQSGHVALRIFPDRNRQVLSLIVEDTGMGIPQDILSELFEPFKQADTSTTRQFGGTGLGLSICHHLVQLMDGDIRVESEVGAGTSFIVEIPLKGPDTFQNNAPVLAGADVLLVGAYQPSLEVLVKHLRSWGGESKVKDIRAAMPLLGNDSQWPDVVIIDLNEHLPEMFELIQLLSSEAADMPVIVCADMIDPEMKMMLSKLTRVHYLISPWSAGNLRHTLQSTMALFDDSTEATNETASNVSEEVNREHNYHDKRVLVVDDTPINLKVAEAMLNTVGVRPVFAANGQEAIDKVNAQDFDLVFMDCLMPVLDGFEATRQIRQHKTSEELTIIALTADAVVQAKDKCLAAGMDDFLTKPIEMERLYNLLERYL